MQTLLAGGLLFLAAVAADAAERPRIAIVIDDMGNRLSAGSRALALPGPVTYAFLPHTPHAARLARHAAGLGKEVMLHLPLESHRGERLGPGGVTLHMTRAEVERTLDAALASVPGVTGVNNHMGSLMTRHPGAMRWLMRAFGRRGLFFIDSRTTAGSVAEQVAQESALATAARDVFLDHNRSEAEVRGQFARLIRIAQVRGRAIAIGHPYGVTLRVLATELARLDEHGVELVAVSRLTRLELRRPLWRKYSSPSPKVAKNSKPSPSSICCDAPESTLSPPDSAQVQ